MVQTRFHRSRRNRQSTGDHAKRKVLEQSLTPQGEKFPAVLVIHENRGLNPYIADVTRRLATEGFLAFAPDALSPLGGYPGNDDEGRAIQARRDRDDTTPRYDEAAAKLAWQRTLAWLNKDLNA